MEGGEIKEIGATNRIVSLKENTNFVSMTLFKCALPRVCPDSRERLIARALSK